ncbi:MAG TPA: DNA mismatch repair endonuclease MutL [bacterium (Candidatus Stahlbacteria)]|nr:DNA mismatch repair endonuclease MutL [Candidatus Stahlbacteria bacterium]
MGRIVSLPEKVVLKIAAGEVIFRPQSVIKELIENAIDARATSIHIEIRKGGKKMIQVSDNGIGMDGDDLKICFLSHTTSKIRSTEDLEKIDTLGFRGEALASIAAVSKLRISSRPHNSELGHLIEVVAGEIVQFTEIGMEKGTQVRVSDLFFTLPARRKFLRSDQWETKLVLEKVRQYAFAYPEIRFILKIDGRESLNLRDSGEKERILQLSGMKKDDLIVIEGGRYPVHVRGYLPEPERMNEGNSIIYVNKRPVTDRKIAGLIRDHYGGRTPFSLLFLDVAPEFYDVNVHPAKSEVRFQDHRYLADLINQVVSRNVKPRIKTTQPMLIAEEIQGLDRFFQFHKSYILVETSRGLVIIDQHAAHERIIYENIMKGGDPGQPLLFPISVELDEEKMELLRKNQEVLTNFGIKTKEFGQRTIVIETIPSSAELGAEDILALFEDLTKIKEERTEIARTIACHSAIKANTPLSGDEMANLVDQLFQCSDPYHCPHGRPTLFQIEIGELENRLGR